LTFIFCWGCLPLRDEVPFPLLTGVAVDIDVVANAEELRKEMLLELWKVDNTLAAGNCLYTDRWPHLPLGIGVERFLPGRLEGTGRELCCRRSLEYPVALQPGLDVARAVLIRELLYQWLLDYVLQSDVALAAEVKGGVA
jgi:hypothetical protein